MPTRLPTKNPLRKLDVPDFLNKYGDRIVAEYLKENSEVNMLLDDPLGLSTREVDGAELEDAAHKVSGLNDQGNAGTDTVIVDVSKCLDKKTIPVKECISTVDMDKGLLTIPCVKFNDTYLTVNMDRRGNSSNWEVSFTKDNANMNSYDPEDDETDDDSTPENKIKK